VSSKGVRILFCKIVSGQIPATLIYQDGGGAFEDQTESDEDHGFNTKPRSSRRRHEENLRTIQLFACWHAGQGRRRLRRAAGAFESALNEAVRFQRAGRSPQPPREARCQQPITEFLRVVFETSWLRVEPSMTLPSPGFKRGLPADG
jgi:hypothetical protein